MTSAAVPSPPALPDPLLAALAAALARLLRVEAANAALLVGIRRRASERRAAWEQMMSAAEQMDAVINREEADAAALEAQQAALHTHVQELRQAIADLKATADAGQTVEQGQVARLAAVADRLEAVVSAEAPDTSEPTA